MQLNWNFWRSGRSGHRKNSFLWGRYRYFTEHGFVMTKENIGLKKILTNQDDEITALFLSLSLNYQHVNIYLTQNCDIVCLMMPEQYFGFGFSTLK